CAAFVAPRFVRHAGHEINDSSPARTVDPDAALHAVGVAGVADENDTADAHVVGTAGDGGRDLLGRMAVAAIEAAIRDAVAPVEAPDLRQHRLDRLRRENAH